MSWYLLVIIYSEVYYQKHHWWKYSSGRNEKGDKISVFLEKNCPFSPYHKRNIPENTLHLLRFVNWLHSLLLDRPILPHPYYKTGRINNCYLLLALTLWSISSPKASHRINEIYHILYHYHSFRHQVLHDKNQICFLCFYLDLILNILNVSLA